MAINDDGAAFPEAGLSGLPNGEFIQGRAGMSLRDYFAAKAISGMLSNQDTVELFGRAARNVGAVDGFTIVAQKAYEVADAMIAERTKDESQ